MDFIEDLKTEMHRLIIRDRKEIPHIILAEGVNLPFNETTGMANNNVIIVGSSGMGKTACLIIPNILEGYQCPIISDPKGSIFSEYEKEITDLYDVRILNLKDIFFRYYVFMLRRENMKISDLGNEIDFFYKKVK